MRGPNENTTHDAGGCLAFPLSLAVAPTRVAFCFCKAATLVDMPSEAVIFLRRGLDGPAREISPMLLCSYLWIEHDSSSRRYVKLVAVEVQIDNLY